MRLKPDREMRLKEEEEEEKEIHQEEKKRNKWSRFSFSSIFWYNSFNFYFSGKTRLARNLRFAPRYERRKLQDENRASLASSARRFFWMLRSESGQVSRSAFHITHFWLGGLRVV